VSLYAVTGCEFSLLRGIPRFFGDTGDSGRDTGDQQVKRERAFDLAGLDREIGVEQVAIDRLKLVNRKRADLLGELLRDEGVHADRLAEAGGRAARVEVLACEDQQAELAHDHTEEAQRLVLFQQPMNQPQRGFAVAPPDGVHHREDVRLGRSEEHTSELQSRENLVCRLLLEKKKKKRKRAKK